MTPRGSVAEDEIAKSPIAGHGLFATGGIVKGEIVAIKGGHVRDLRTLVRTHAKTAVPYVQIEDLSLP